MGVTWTIQKLVDELKMVFLTCVIVGGRCLQKSNFNLKINFNCLNSGNLTLVGQLWVRVSRSLVSTVIASAVIVVVVFFLITLFLLLNLFAHLN